MVEAKDQLGTLNSTLIRKTQVLKRLYTYLDTQLTGYNCIKEEDAQSLNDVCFGCIKASSF